MSFADTDADGDDDAEPNFDARAIFDRAEHTAGREWDEHDNGRVDAAIGFDTGEQHHRGQPAEPGRTEFGQRTLQPDA